MYDAMQRSRKSRMKKRPENWEHLKQEIAQELGLWDTVQKVGWSGLSAEDSGRLGGIFAARKKALMTQEKTPNDLEQAGAVGSASPILSAEDVIGAEVSPPKTQN